jgi:tetratricopeptide (TPR) repeat protein
MLLIAGLSVLLFFVVASVFLYRPIKDKFTKTSQQTVQEPDGALPELVCNYASDQKAYADAVTTQNVNQCACIKDETLMETCKSTTMDVMFYANAIDHIDKTLCDKINDQEQKNACILVVEDSIEQLTEKDPQYLATMYASTHNENAITIYEKLTQEDQSNIDNFITLALSYAEKGLKEQEQGNDQTPYVQKAFQAIEKAKSIDQNNAEVYRVEAYINEIKPDYSVALALYNKALTLDANNVLAYAGKGHTERMMGILENAVADFTKAAELDTQKAHVHIYTNLCNLEYSRSHNEDAIKNCKIVTQMQNTDPVFQSEAYQIMAMIFIQNQDYTQARNYLLTAKTLTPNDPNLYVTFAKLNIYEQNYTESESNAKKAIELSPTKATGYLSLAQALYMQEKHNESIQTAQKGITLVKGDVSLLAPSKPVTERDLNYMIAHNYRQMGDTQKQAEYEKKAEESFK